MAIVNNEICDIVKKCKILLLDIEGTTTSISFVKDKLFPYAEENVKEFLDTQWEKEEVKAAVAALKKLALEDKEKSVEGVVAIPGEDATKDEQIEGLVNNVKWLMSADRKVGSLKELQGLIWKLGYDKGDIKGHVYDDVSPALEQWKSTEGQKVYIYSSGSVQAQKLLFGQSVVGDLLPLIEGHFDTGVGAKQDAASYVAIVEKIGCKPEEILFLTDIVKEAEAARASGLQTALVSREGNAPLPADATSTFPVLHSFAQLVVNNKRKPESQEEELPAKIPKTDVEDNVKTNNEVKANETAPTEAKEVTETTAPKVDAPAIVVTAPEETEKMEVEEEVPVEKTAEPAEVKEKVEESTEVPAKLEAVVEEVTDAMESVDAPMVTVEPVVEETVEKTEKSEKNETEKMEAEPIENVETAVTEPKVVADEVKQDAAVAEETPGAVITEIEDVTNDPDTFNEVTDIIDDLVPVIEEPPATEDMEELQNVGEVLEKECDEILSKVQDVTNLDSIPMKPLLNTIAEETMETENLDSNDIVDRILDTEIEMGIKTGDDIDLNEVKEITKTVETEAKNDITEGEVTKDNAEEKPAENVESSVSETEKPKVEETPKAELITNGNAVESHPASVDEKVEDTAKPVENVQKEEPSTEPQESSKSSDETVSEAPKVEGKIEENNVDEKTQKEETVTEVATETKESVPEEVKIEKQVEKQVNGKATNGNGEISLNGDSSKDEELSARLSVDNGKEVVNGANGDSAESEEGQGDKVEKDIPDIKVKSVATDEPRTDPIEQPTEA